MSPVKRGCPSNATACPPTMRYSTLREFNNSMNSLKSAYRFAKSTPVLPDQFEENVEPFFARQVGIKLGISSLGIFETHDPR